MNVFEEFKTNITRRHFFAQGSHAVGWAALAALLGRDMGSGGGSTPTTVPVPGNSSRAEHRAHAFPGQGQASHLSAHGWRAAAAGSV